MLAVVVLALTLGDAKNIAVGGVAFLLIGAVLAAWVMKTILQKLVAVVVLALFAFAVSTQRTSLQDCADKVKGNFAIVDTDVTVTDTDCSFFGVTVTVKDPRAESDGT